MISSPEPDKATHQSTLDEHFLSEMIPDQQETQQQHQLDAENLLVDKQVNVRRQVFPRFQWRELSLRVKATMLAIALGTLPVLGIGAIAYYFANQTLVKQIKQEKQERAVEMADKINHFMFERQADIQIMSDFLRTFSDPMLRKITSPQEQEAKLNHFIEVYKFYDSIALFDPNGNVIVQSQGKVSRNIKERRYFQAVLKTDRAFIDQPEKSPTTGKISIYIASPVKDTVTGKTIAVLRTRMPVEFISEVVRNFGTNEDRYHLFDSSKNYFVVKDKDDLGLNVLKDFPSVAHLMQGEEKVASEVTTDSENHKRLIAYTTVGHIEGLPDLNWGVLLTTPTEIAFATQRNLLLSIVLGSALTALLVSLIAAHFANRATRPILAATDTVEKLGQGELFTRLDVTGKDELATLGFNINRMADQIQTLLESQASEAERAHLFAEIATSRTLEDLDTVLAQAVVGIRKILNADRIVIYRFNADWTGYIAAESVLSGWPAAINGQITDACIDEKIREAYRNERVVATSDVFEAGFHPDHLKLLERLQIKANLVTAIVSQGQLFGLLIAHHCSGPYFWQQNEINFLMGAAGQIGLILDRVSLLEQKKLEAERAELLKDATIHMAQSSNLQDILNAAVENARQGLKTDRVVVYGLDPVTWKGTVMAEAVAPDWPISLGVEIDDACLREGHIERYRKGQVTQINNVHKEPRINDCYLKTLSRFAVRANLVAPIVKDNQLFGLLIAHQCDKPRVWQQDEIDVFTQLATQIGVTLDRASLLEKLEQARQAAEINSLEQRQQKETLQQRALALLMEVDPISRGDLTIRAHVTEDEIGTVADSYNATVGSLRKIVTQVQAAAQQVAATTSNNEVSVGELSTEALRQAEEITTVLAQIQQMTDSIRAVAANAKQAEAVVKQANQTVEAGDAAMNRTVDGIMAIQETVMETSEKVKRLGESSQKISKVVKLIGAFADQTNLLALNAAIEAARAGEQGRGFAVIADEVGTLARQSQAATAEIEALVAEIQAETNEVVTAMAVGTKQVATGTRLVDDTRNSLNKITAASTQISGLVEEIAQAAVAQSQTSETVTQTITGVAAIANKNSNEATLVSASFKKLLAVAQELQASVDRFKVS